MIYHYVLTLMFPEGTGRRMRTLHGIVDITEGTRDDVFIDLLNYATDGCPEKGNVMFFALEPNELPAA